MRINKLLSNWGYCSRKDANRWIDNGRVCVNGQPGRMGQWVEESDEICLDGIKLFPKEKVYLLLNKPVGITCTAETEVENNIVAFLNYPDYVFPVGRLDKDSEGLMFLTNDGDLANHILDAENGHEKVYLVTVNKPLTETFLRDMAAGVVIDGKQTKPCQLEALGTYEFQIILSQGLNRQIRKMCQSFHYKVVNLKRVSILNLQLGDLPLGAWRHVSPEELMQLCRVMVTERGINEMQQNEIDAQSILNDH